VRILDARSLVVGTAVARSARFVGRLTGRARRRRARRQIGILVGVQYDADDGLYWPRVHWEGQGRPSLTHPVCVRPLRRTRLARYVDADVHYAGVGS